MFDLTGKRVWIAGHKGLVGSALLKRLATENCVLLTVEKSELDLCVQADVESWIAYHKPQVVIIAAAKVGGIEANRSFPTDFLYDNALISLNIIHAAAQYGVEKLVNLASNCMYPRLAEQPIKENSLLTGPLEPTNEAYALAKIAATKLTEYYFTEQGKAFITIVPTSLYGAGDHFDEQRSHVIPALLRKFYLAKQQGLVQIEAWGTGSPTREFMYIDDAADGIVFLLKHYNQAHHINLCGTQSISIKALSDLIQKMVGYEGEVVWDTSKPDGMPHKALDATRLFEYDWRPKILFEKGLALTYDDFLQRHMKS